MGWALSLSLSVAIEDVEGWSLYDDGAYNRLSESRAIGVQLPIMLWYVPVLGICEDRFEKFIVLFRKKGVAANASIEKQSEITVRTRWLF